MKMNNVRLNEIGGVILDASIEVHRVMGPGLLEIPYELALMTELSVRGLNVKRQYAIDLTYKGIDLEKAFFIDLLVEDEILIEVKSVAEMRPIFEAQLMTYLKLTNKKLGYLINFNVTLLKHGFKRIVYNF